ncbi:histidine kinase [Streptomyces sp. NPDC050703]|uniref:sensor histidine kinase n=1 Tax=Streptomyces sp. NPDC050703 TaxID=3157218 RepID=UPI003417FA0D
MERRTRSALLWAVLAVPVVTVDRLGLNEPAGAWRQLVALAVLAGAVVARGASPLLAFLLAASLGLATAPSLFTLSYGPALAVFALLTGRGAGRPRAAALGFGAVALVGTVKIAVRDVDPVVEWLVLTGTLLFGAVFPWLAGRYWRQNRELAAAGWARAEQLEREQRIVADRARLRERARIAQDMHDDLGHELSLIAVRAGALQVAPDLPAPHREAAADLRAAASHATDRLHAVIGLLREEGDERAPLAPSGETIPALVTRAAESGLEISYLDGGLPGDGLPGDGGLGGGRLDGGRSGGGRLDGGCPAGGQPDGGDGGQSDGGRSDGGVPDGGRHHGGPPDDGRPDDGRHIGGQPDGGYGGQSDGGRSDGGVPDGGRHHGGPPDDGRSSDGRHTGGPPDGGKGGQPPGSKSPRAAAQGAPHGVPQDASQGAPQVAAQDATARALHRVVQEALTNAARHAPGAPVTVAVDRDAAATTVTVTNGRPTAPAPPSRGGSGLRGLRDRVTDLGGTFEAGPYGQGYRVTARLPVPGAGRGRPRPGAHLAHARRRTALAFGAALTTGALLVGGAFAWYAYSRTHSVLDPADFAGLRIGEARADAERVLPSLTASDPPAERAPTPPPEDADCVYYRAEAKLFSTVPYFRLCFGRAGDEADRLVDKTVIPVRDGKSREK